MVDSLITSQPQNVSGDIGQTVELKVVAAAAKTYQWQRQDNGMWTNVSGENYTGQNTDTLTIMVNETTSGRNYKCVVTAASLTENSTPAAVSIKAIVITSQPVDLTRAVSEQASFTVYAVNGTSYKWYYKKPDEETWGEVTVGGTSATYTLTVASRHNGYKYKCKVSNAESYLYSGEATLTVTN